MVMVELLTESPYSPPSTPGPYRVADYFALPDEPRCELIYGRMYMSPAPSARHQLICAMLYRLLDSCVGTGGGEIYFAPVDVVLLEHSVVQPDIVYLSPERRHLVRDRIDGAPDLAIEVISPGTARHDRGTKLRLYAQCGVREYWIVDPVSQSFTFLVNAGSQFVVNAGSQFLVALPEDDRYTSAVVIGLAVDLAAFWQEFARRTD